MPTNRSKAVASMPVLDPPDAQAATTQAAPAPRELTSDELAVAAQEGADAVGPTLEPPAVTARSSDGITAWQSDKRITAMFSTADARNVWIAIGGIGWRKLFNGNDSAHAVMSIIAAHAKQMNSPVNYREEADGLIHEIYAW